jgi:predicted small integral membrane protein
MVWTLPVAVFFTVIVVMLIGMTIWEIRAPTIERRGFLPIATTRGDRLFIGLLSVAYFNLAFVGLGDRFAQWFALEGEPSPWIGLALSMSLLVWVMRKG